MTSNDNETDDIKNEIYENISNISDSENNAEQAVDILKEEPLLQCEIEVLLNEENKTEEYSSPFEVPISKSTESISEILTANAVVFEECDDKIKPSESSKKSLDMNLAEPYIKNDPEHNNRSAEINKMFKFNTENEYANINNTKAADVDIINSSAAIMHCDDTSDNFSETLNDASDKLIDIVDEVNQIIPFGKESNSQQSKIDKDEIGNEVINTTEHNTCKLNGNNTILERIPLTAATDISTFNKENNQSDAKMCIEENICHQKQAKSQIDGKN